jgi:16S rRNA (guanine966-N2)-methyltransferase
VRQLLETVRLLRLDQVQVEQAEALRWLDGAPEPFDIVFLDPPYGAGLQGPAAARLEAGGWLSPGAQVYLEHARGSGLPELPTGWEMVREKRAGQVSYCLLRRA